MKRQGKIKMKEEKRGRYFLVATFLLIFLIQITSAANVGVSPANIDFKNVLRNGYAERPIIVTIDSESPTTIEVQTYGNISNWINYTSKTLEVSKGNPLQLMVSVRPPSDTPNGNYTGFLRIKSSKLAPGVEGQTTGLVIPTLDIFITTEVTDQEFLSCDATNFKISNAEEGEDLILTVDIENKGNIRISPKTFLEIWDQTSTNLIDEIELSSKQIIPTQKDQMVFKIPTDSLELGQYWAEISVPDCYSSRTLTFDVLEEGALWAGGSLERIFVQPWADIGDIVQITALFKNTGEKALEAKFSGKVMYEGKVIQLLESNEPLFIQTKDQDNFQFFFTPQKEGKYIISGRVFYAGKRSYEQSAILNVRPASALTKVLKTASYIILIILIATLLYKIRKERRSYLNLKKRR